MKRTLVALLAAQETAPEVLRALIQVARDADEASYLEITGGESVTRLGRSLDSLELALAGALAAKV